MSAVAAEGFSLLAGTEREVGSRMIAEIVAVGTELLLGQIANTDAQLLSRWLADLGVDVYRQVTVGDNLERAIEALRTAAGRADLVITTGGLGPTYDDITRQAVAAASGRPLVEHPDALEHVRYWFRARGLPWSEINRRQALVPEGAEVLANPRGTAPAFWLEGKPVFVALPGPPRELEAVFWEHVRPRLEARSGAAIISRILKVVGLGESSLEPRLEDLYRSTQPTVAPYAKLGEVHLRVTAKARTAAEAEALVAPVAAEIRRRLGHFVYGEGDDTLAAAILARLRQRGMRLAVAESVTGGLVASRLTEVPGASAVFTGGMVVYQEAAKARFLAVPESLLATYGAVSREVVLFLARRVREVADAEVGLATVGFAGPTGEDIGRTLYAVVDPWGETVEERRFLGDRDEIRQRLLQAALTALWLRLAEEGSVR